MADQSRGYPLLSNLQVKGPEFAEFARLIWDQIYSLRDELTVVEGSVEEVAQVTQIVVTEQAALATVYVGAAAGGPSTAELSAGDVMLNVPSILVPNAEGVLLDGSALLDAGRVYQVEYEVVNLDGVAPVTVSIGLDIGAGGALAGAEYIMTDVVVPAGGSTGAKKLVMAAEDDIRGIASAASDAAIRFLEVLEIA